MATGNALCHHNSHLKGHFKFLRVSRMICFPLNISEKLHLQHHFEKLEGGKDYHTFISIKTKQHPLILKNNINHLSKRGPPPFFHSDTSPALGHSLVHSADKTDVLTVTVELIWLFLLNIPSFNFVQTPNKSLRFRRFRRNYVNHPVKVSANHCQSFTAFFFDVRRSKWPRPVFAGVCH